MLAFFMHLCYHIGCNQIDYHIFGRKTMEYNKSVAISSINEYDVAKIKETLSSHFDALGIDISAMRGKNVAIKPNLVMKKPPEAAATTHPAVIRALLLILNEADIEPIIAESPGGIYSPQRMEGFYRICGMYDAAEGLNVRFNTDVSAQILNSPFGSSVKSFNIISPIANADVIFDVCKLKTHSLTAMSGAVKNLFGTIPGIEKFEMHAAHPECEDFEAMICDLCDMHCRRCEVIAITDAIVGMEGDGPTGGEPKSIGCLLTSRNPFASDLAAERILDFSGVGTVAHSKKRGYVPENSELLEYPLLCPKDVAVQNIVPAASRGKTSISALKIFSGGIFGKILSPRPEIDTAKCRGCGECKTSCPQHTIDMISAGGKKVARIDRKNCIRCYCCQELCPFTAIKTKRNIILRAVSKFR